MVSDDACRYPRVAILSLTNISESTATGSLLFKLFENWPRERLFQLCSLVATDAVARQYNDRVLKLHSYERARRDPSTVIGRLYNCGADALNPFLALFCSNQRQILRALTEFRPDVLYFRVAGDPGFYLALPKFLTGRFAIRYAVHIMDDYDELFRQGANTVAKKLLSGLYAHRLARVVHDSSVNFAISPSMADELRERYNASFEVVHNGIDVQDLSFSSIRVGKRTPKGVVRLLWAGAIDEHKEGQVAHATAQAVHELNCEQSFKYELLLNVPPGYLRAAQALSQNYRGVSAQPYLPRSEYAALLARFDALIIARNFDELSKSFTRNSFHNKLPEYLVSGTPIIYIGPTWGLTYEILSTHKLGIVITRPEVVEIRRELLRFCYSLSDYDQMTSRAFEYAKTNFAMDKIRSRFETVISRLAGTRR